MYAEEATKEVNQPYIITTFDRGVCMKAYPLIWNNPDRHEKHIILIGTFHLACAYMKMIGKQMYRSGLSDILLETGLIASGSIEGALSGTHYDRAMQCQKVMLECLERLLLSQYVTGQGEDQVLASVSEQSRKVLNDVLHSPSADTVNTALADDALHNYIHMYDRYAQSQYSCSMLCKCCVILSYSNNRAHVTCS